MAADRDDLTTAYGAISAACDALSVLAGHLDAAITYGCPLTLGEVQAKLSAARALAAKGQNHAFSESLKADRLAHSLERRRG
jgi:hypothetical protein